MAPYLHPLPDLPTATTDDPAEVLQLLADRWVLVGYNDGTYVLSDPYSRPCVTAASTT